MTDKGDGVRVVGWMDHHESVWSPEEVNHDGEGFKPLILAVDEAGWLENEASACWCDCVCCRGGSKELRAHAKYLRGLK